MAGLPEGIVRIATEEAYAPADLIERYKTIIRARASNDPGFESLMGYFLFNDSPRTNAIVERLQDVDERRIADMDAAGIDKQIVSLTAPGLQVFDAATAAALAGPYNDELERAVTKLGFRGAIINSHTHGEYLDDEKFWPIFEAAEALDVPVYVHPQTPPPSMIGPLLESGLDGAIYGFAVETGMHLLRIIMSGVFDRFPRLKLVVGHLGEGIPYWLFRVDFFHRGIVSTKRYARIRELEHKPSDYMRRNVYLTTSGMAWEPVIMYARSVVGPERVLYAMDYPYQYVPDEVRVTDELPLSADELEQFYQRNAERVFGLRAAPSA